MSGFFGRDYREAPVREGDVLDVKIVATGEKGDGIARVNNFVVFVPGKKEGEEAKIRITKVLRKVAFAEVIGGAEAAPAEEKKEAEEKKAKPKEEAEPKVEVYEEESENF